MGMHVLPELAPGREVVLPGRGTTFIRELAGPPGARTVILLHGWTATGGLNWATSMGPLSERYRVIAIDHRGHGHGLQSDTAFTLEDCADDVSALMRVLGIKSAMFAGYSMGGPIAQLMWQRHRQQVDGLIMCATAARFPHSAPVDMPMSISRVLLGLVPAQLRRAYSPLAAAGIATRLTLLDELGASNPARMLEAGRSLTRFDSRRWLHRVTVPTAMLMTTRDGLVPVPLQRELADLIPGTRVYPVRAGHISAALTPQFVRSLGEAVDGVARQIGARQAHPPGPGRHRAGLG